MNYAEVIILGVALAVDAMVYSFSYGLLLRRRRASSALWLALTVGGFQAGMPLLGYAGGDVLKDTVGAYSGVIVPAVFLALAGSILYNTWFRGGDEEACPAEPLGFLGLMGVGIATAIDALAVGVCMALGDLVGSNPSLLQVLTAAGIIGIITFAASLAAFHSARLLHRLPRRAAETLAALLLIALAVRAAL